MLVATLISAAAAISAPHTPSIGVHSSPRMCAPRLSGHDAQTAVIKDRPLSSPCVAPPTVASHLMPGPIIASHPALQPTSVAQRKMVQSHLTPGPVMLSWAAAATTMALQLLCTDWLQLGQDAQLCWSFASESLPLSDLLLEAQQSPNAPYVALYALLWINVVGCSFFVMPVSFPPQQSKADSQGQQLPLEVPHRSQNMVQHQLGNVDYSYVVLNTLCMPGFFYHFFCLMRSWGFDPAAPLPVLTSVKALSQMAAATLPEAVGALALYFVVYEFVYYRWHRAMHEVPALYKWVHKHHHQQTYPDRPALDTLNTSCVESQVGLYSQLAMLWSCDKLLGAANVPAATAFLMLAGWLSVLEHDKFERPSPSASGVRTSTTCITPTSSATTARTLRFGTRCLAPTRLSKSSLRDWTGAAEPEARGRRRGYLALILRLRQRTW